MTSIPLTVALLTYNRSHYLREAIQGILDQTYKDFEFLILDNASTDDTPSVVLGYSDPRIRYVRNAPGGTSIFNGISAMQIARGKRIIITHDDDIMMPTILEQQMDIMDRHPDVMAVWTNVSVIDETGRLIQPYLVPKGDDRIYKCGEFISQFPAEQILPLPSTLILDRTKAPKFIFYDHIYYGLADQKHRFHGGDDILVPALMNTRGSVVFLNEPLLKYRRHSSQDTNDVHISKTVLNTHKLLHKLLRKYASKIPNSAYATLLLENYVVRYEVQNMIVHIRSERLGKGVLSKLTALLERGLDNARENHEANDPLLPVLILASQVGGNAEELFNGLTEPVSTQPKSVCALYRWAMLNRAGRNLFSSIPSGANVAILGSALVAALLVNEAKAYGLKVACMDSKPSRQNGKMLGVPIHAPGWLKSQGSNVEYVILSSERDQEDYLRQFIQGLNRNVKILSWKDLAVGKRSGGSGK